MNTYSSFGKPHTNPSSVVIEFDSIKLDILIWDISAPFVSPYAYQRPYLSVMADRNTNQIFAFAITLKCPSPSDPLNSLIVSHKGRDILQRPNLVIRTDRALFCRKLLNGVLGRAVFRPAHWGLEKRCPLERAITGLAQGLKDILPVRALPGGVKVTQARSVGQLRATLRHLIKASNSARNARLDMARITKFMYCLGKQS
ncbi:hypothetical protein [Pseudomonas typographi]|uniref:hypothetical protein n=1 Tax=Pseudomonas typographi TaxID=2715964 RepID=UPI00168816DE|nr:hypothetical protein [Pseudomonas typographi]MBD1554826.1 hypothetical protein [Pseudomonas typographi]